MDLPFCKGGGDPWLYNQLGLAPDTRTGAPAGAVKPSWIISGRYTQINGVVQPIFPSALTFVPACDITRDIPEIREASEAITRAAVSQAKIIDDLLDLSRIRTGNLALQTTKTDAARVLLFDTDIENPVQRDGTLRASIRGRASPRRRRRDQRGDRSYFHCRDLRLVRAVRCTGLHSASNAWKCDAESAAGPAQILKLSSVAG
jgi:hypothetical protein